jgi:putative Holliday junction resolvase
MIGRVLGIDYGSRRVGISLSDPLRIIASGAGVMQNTPPLVKHIARIVDDQHVVLIVVGMPYAPDGGTGKKGEEVLRFIQRLESAVAIPVTTWDESFTTVDAGAALRKAGMKKKQRRQKGVLDEMAARLMLQEYLDVHEGK